MLNGVAAVEPPAVVEFEGVLSRARALLDERSPGANLRSSFTEEKATWRIAVVSTIIGFDSWCSRVEIETAVLWVSESLPHLFKQPTAN